MFCTDEHVENKVLHVSSVCKTMDIHGKTIL